jgi:hypothetical protein
MENNNLGKFVIGMIALATLGSCQSDAGRKAEMERIKAERAYDSIKVVGKAKIDFYNCQEKLLIVGADPDTAKCKCREIYYEGFVYDSIDNANEQKKTDTVKQK